MRSVASNPASRPFLPPAPLAGMALLSVLGVCDPQSPSAAFPDAPIAARVLSCGANVAVSSVTTPPVALVDDALVLVWVASATSDPTNLPVVRGGGITWDLVETNVRGAGIRRVSVFRGMPSAAFDGPLTIEFAGQEQQMVGWGIVEHTGVDTSGDNGSRAVVQTATADAIGFQTQAVIRPPSPSRPGNAMVGGFLVGAEDDVRPGSGFIELFEGGVPNRRMMVLFRSSPGSSVDVSWDGGAHWIGIALELESGAEGVGPAGNPTLLSTSCNSPQLSGARRPAAGPKAKGSPRPGDRGIRRP